MIRQFLRLCLVVAMSLGPISHAKTTQADIQAEEYAVYSSLIETRYSCGSNGLVVINDATRIQVIDHSLSNDLEFVHQQIPSIQQKMLDDFKALNSQSYRLSRNFNIKNRYALVGGEEFQEIFKSGVEGWKIFRSKFPGSPGSISFSRVVLNPAMNEAFLYMSISCGESCGEGSYIILDKREGNWKIEKEAKVWQLRDSK